MTARIPFAQRLQSLCSSLLIVLMIAAVCSGVQQPKAVQRRTPRLSGLKTIQLPEPVSTNTTTLETALVEQQQAIAPSDQRLQFTDISQLAWAAQGVRVPRAASVAAAAANKEQPPLKVYFVLADGVYTYNPVEHSLQQASNADGRQDITTSVLGRPGRIVGGAQIVLAGSSRDFAAQYGPRARTAMLLQAGQAVQSIELEAVALGLTFVGTENININIARRVLRLSKGLEPLYALFVGYPASQAPAVTTEPPVVTAPSGKKVLLVVPQQGYQDQELAETKRALELAGVSVLVASTRQGPLVGTFGGQVKADLLVNQVNLSDYGAIVFIGGPGAIDYFNNPSALTLARQASDQRKVVAAIGTAPTILANAGVLKGVRATGFLPEQERIQRGGAVYTGNPVEKDGLTITATGALAAPLFVQAILEGLSQAG